MQLQHLTISQHLDMDICSTILGLVFFSFSSLFLSTNTYIPAKHTLHPSKQSQFLQLSSNMLSIKTTTVALLAILCLYLETVLAFSPQTFTHDRTTSINVPTSTLIPTHSPTPTPTALLETTSPFDRENALQAEQVYPPCKSLYSSPYAVQGVLTTSGSEEMRWDVHPWTLLLHSLPLVSL